MKATTSVSQTWFGDQRRDQAVRGVEEERADVRLELDCVRGNRRRQLDGCAYVRGRRDRAQERAVNLALADRIRADQAAHRFAGP
jgi:hypothetical protein